MPLLRRMYALKKNGGWDAYRNRVCRFHSSLTSTTHSFLQFRNIAASTRANDTTSLKPLVQTLVVPNPEKDVLDPPVNGRSESKHNHGANHDFLRLLIMGPPDRSCFPVVKWKRR